MFNYLFKEILTQGFPSGWSIISFLLTSVLKRNVWNLITTRRKKVPRKLLFGYYTQSFCWWFTFVSRANPITVSNHSHIFSIVGWIKKGEIGLFPNWNSVYTGRCWKATVQTPFTSSSTSRVCPWHVPSTYFPPSTGNRRGVRLDDRISWWTLVRICRRLICERIRTFPLLSLFKFTDQKGGQWSFSYRLVHGRCHHR